MGCDTVCGGVKHDFISMSSSVRWRISQSFGTATRQRRRSANEAQLHMCTIYTYEWRISLPPSPLGEVVFSPSGVLQQPPHQYVTRCQSGRSFTATCAEEIILLYAIFCTLRGAGVDCQWFMAQEWMVTTSYLAVRVDHWCARALLSLTCYYYCRGMAGWMNEWLGMELAMEKTNAAFCDW